MKIIRQTGMFGAAMNLAVYVNDKKVDSLTSNEELEIDLKSDNAQIRVGQGFIKSKPITVTQTDTVIAKSSMMSYFFSFFGVIPILGKGIFYLEIKE